MNIFGWIGIFCIIGGGLFAGAAWSMCRGRRITAVEAKVISLPKPDDGGEGEQDTDGDSAVEYEFPWNGETLRVRSQSPTACREGESEKMYYDSFSGALYHPRMLRSMLIAAAAFVLAGAAMIVFQQTLLS